MLLSSSAGVAGVGLGSRLEVRVEHERQLPAGLGERSRESTLDRAKNGPAAGRPQRKAQPTTPPSFVANTREEPPPLAPTLGCRGPPRPNRRPPPSSLRSSAIWASPRHPKNDPASARTLAQGEVAGSCCFRAGAAAVVRS